MSTESAVRRLADVDEVRRLILRTWASIDRHDWDGYAAGFREDGIFEILGQRRHGRAEIVAGPARDLAKYEQLQHLVMNEVIEVEGDDGAGTLVRDRDPCSGRGRPRRPRRCRAPVHVFSGTRT